MSRAEQIKAACLSEVEAIKKWYDDAYSAHFGSINALDQRDQMALEGVRACKKILKRIRALALPADQPDAVARWHRACGAYFGNPTQENHDVAERAWEALRQAEAEAGEEASDG